MIELSAVSRQPSAFIVIGWFTAPLVDRSVQGRHAKVKFLLANLLFFIELAVFGLAVLFPAFLARDIVLDSMMV